ncbi:fatty acid--CoA ligase family protein [Dactylosporangium sp. NPDC005572]|uniref:class I adenylate-forming enzyme family protein n=1 Tax=Dactylosporangium sp. NPDC005572 TaxID=3156889 RepID=UPI0033B95C5D
MAATGAPDAVAVEHRARRSTYAQLARLSAGGAGIVSREGADSVLFLGVNSTALPVALFAAAAAGVPFVPLNYRLSAEQVRALAGRFQRPLTITDAAEVLDGPGPTYGLQEWVDACSAAEPLASADVDPESIAVLLFTSGTTAEPKAAVLRHRHLVSYVLSTVEFGSAGPDEANLVSVPPYHIAAVANLLTNIYAGRRLVYLDSFSPGAWLDLARASGATHAMLVPTMLARIADHLAERGEPTPGLRSVSYGGARMPQAVLEQVLAAFPDTGFVNAYGLTETSSTIALLGPDDHRAAVASDAPEVRARLGSVGRPVPGVTIAVFDAQGRLCPPGVRGELRVKGPQVAGEYLGGGALLDKDGWFHTRDQAYLDADGYLFVEGRLDDTIIRGGENIAPAEIEETLLAHPQVADAAVVGMADDEWGQRILAYVVPHSTAQPDAEELRSWVRTRLRSSKTPDEVIFRTDLPRTETGKILRRLLHLDTVDSSSGSVS